MPLYSDLSFTKCGLVPAIANHAISVNSPKHDDGFWHILSPVVRDAVVAHAHQLATNKLKPTECANLLQNMIDGDVIVAEEKDSEGEGFTDYFLAHGGINAVSEELFSHVDPLVRALEGKSPSRQTLEELKGQQLDQWPAKVGYLDYVTDSRSDEYFRLYVGQSGDRFARITMHQHAQAILQSKRNTLHHFTTKIGNGFRTANFVRI